MKIAWFTPYNRKSAIGQYSAQVLKVLALTDEVTVYASDAEATCQCWPVQGAIRFLKRMSQEQLLGELAGFDCVVYNMGDYLDYHRSVYETSLIRPGILILHDLVLHHFFAGYFLIHKKDADAYIRAMAYSHGAEGEEIARQILAGRRPAVWEEPAALVYHMARPALYRQYGVIVHSDYARRQLEDLASVPVAKINFPEPRLAQHFGTQPVPRARPTGERLQVLTYGMVNVNKMIDLVIDTIGRDKFLKASISYTIIGACESRDYQKKIEKAISGLEDTVRWRGHQPEEVLVDAIREADIIVNLRNPYLGESSWSLLEALYAGKATVVWRHGYYDECPDRILKKVASREELAAALTDLCRNPEERQRIGSEARAYARKNFTTPHYCRQLLDFIETARLNKPILDLVDTMSDRLLEMGTTGDAQGLLNTVETEICNLAGIV